jgi:hypothetical protein
MYNVFGSGASHAIYAQFMAQLALANRGRKVCLICGAGTHMALWFYATYSSSATIEGHNSSTEILRSGSDQQC